jgi:soluble lytic murein transglycosylase-like protein
MSFDPNSLTTGQRLVWDLFPQLNEEAGGWWTHRLPDLFAFVQIESSFNPRAYRFEPRLHKASYGLMQLLYSTACQMGYNGGNFKDLYDPKTNLRYGMKYAQWGWNYLTQKFGTAPTPTQWSAGYNEGYGAAARREPDPAYSNAWLHCRNYWSLRFGS